MPPRVLTSLLIVIMLLPPWAQAADRVHRLAFLTPASAATTRTLPLLIQELARFGLIEGRNIAIQGWFGEGRPDRLPELASDLVGLSPDVIVAVSNPAIAAAKAATSTTPIVMAFAGEDPVAAGFVQSFALPGGTVTGVAMLATETNVKRAELLAQALPEAKRLAVLAQSAQNREALELAKGMAVARHVELAIFAADSAQDYDRAFGQISASEAAGLIVLSSPVFFADAADIAGRAAKLRLPTVCEWRQMAEEGCLMSYGPNLSTLYRRVAGYVVRIVNGGTPAAMPVEQPTTFEVVVNLNTARTLGVELPVSFLARADELIE